MLHASKDRSASPCSLQLQGCILLTCTTSSSVPAPNVPIPANSRDGSTWLANLSSDWGAWLPTPSSKIKSTSACQLRREGDAGIDESERKRVASASAVASKGSSSLSRLGCDSDCNGTASYFPLIAIRYNIPGHQCADGSANVQAHDAG
jgi:hypothetical protein